MLKQDDRTLPSGSGGDGQVGLFDSVLARSQSQEILFAESPSRVGLQTLDLPSRPLGQYCANVWRNQNFETFEGLLKPFLNYAQLELEFRVHGYDDTLDFTLWEPAEVEILWLDSSRYTDRMAFEDWQGWLRSRLLDLRSRSTAPILVASWDAWRGDVGVRSLDALVNGVPGAYVADLGAACHGEGVTLLDPRVAKVSGSPISRSAQMVLARWLGCRWLPGLLLPPIKAVAVDLDNTLHAGVLGEDGVVGVQLESGHKALQSALWALKARGVFLALVSRNEREDVEALFTQRPDYPLCWDDFSAIEVSWGSKVDALHRVAQQLRIALNAVLFIDDNLGELASVAAGCPEVHILLASPEGTQTYRALQYYPGLWRWSVSADDAHRIQDMKANAERDRLARVVGDTGQYFQELGITLALRYDAAADLPRLAELCRKTNQFNLALRRYNEADLAAFMARNDASVVAVSLSDRLSNSGTIAVLVAVREQDVLVVEELCISCRALGRQLEDTIVLASLRGVMLFEGCRQVRFNITEGSRNRPARDWFSRLMDRFGGLHRDGEVQAEWIAHFSPPSGVMFVQE
ncbi:HAD-IIIC family phosphatase [Castellaniella defragrans]|uniref:HAD-IIIC family phosphatase n=1 Tax=Castellaniella defragrans TaxID=75697 RepID=UPI002AFEE199|nr:HAD-IIIC family phosphatase [Castellaniella defragrans]